MCGQVYQDWGDLVANRDGRVRLADHIVVRDWHQQRMRALTLAGEFGVLVILGLDQGVLKYAVGFQDALVDIFDVRRAAPTGHKRTARSPSVFVREDKGIAKYL